MVQNKKLNMDDQTSFDINRRHKDSLFRIAFREKKDLLELYNAINGSDYKDPEELIVYTLEDVVFMGIKNDISFLIGEMLSLYEHQSTKDPNMPIRGLMYFARNYSAYIARNNLDIYGTTLQRLPFPQYYVLYNGREDEEDRCTIELEDAFPKIEGIEPCLKCTATLLNINYGHNREIMEQCKTLHDYAFFIQKIRDNQTAGMMLSEAVDDAAKKCIEEGVLQEILLKNRAEVKNMVLGAWGTENHLRKVKEEQERRRQELKELNRETDRIRQKNVEMEQKNAEMEQKNAEMEQKNAEMEQKNAEMEQKNAEMEQKNAEMERRVEALSSMTRMLIDDGKLEELKRASLDKEYQTKLLKEYRLI